tara:strand:+ start:1345 stop:1599 length:255 start_codon:yes stop_codon:yes gene_type:complete
MISGFSLQQSSGLNDEERQCHLSLKTSWEGKKNKESFSFFLARELFHLFKRKRMGFSYKTAVFEKVQKNPGWKKFTQKPIQKII